MDAIKHYIYEVNEILIIIVSVIKFNGTNVM